MPKQQSASRHERVREHNMQLLNGFASSSSEERESTLLSGANQRAAPYRVYMYDQSIWSTAESGGGSQELTCRSSDATREHLSFEVLASTWTVDAGPKCAQSWNQIQTRCSRAPLSRVSFWLLGPKSEHYTRIIQSYSLFMNRLQYTYKVRESLRGHR